MATTFTTLLGRVRINLLETTARFWSDAEIIVQLNNGMFDLQKALNALYQDYFLTVDVTNCSIAANASVVTGVPADVMVVRGIEPRVASNFPDLEFVFKPYNSPAFVQARAMVAQDPTQLAVILVAITGSAGPVAAGTIHVAPAPTTAIPLRLSYIPSIAAKVAADNNPIPGESDKALECYATAYCLAKIREEKTPDPDWLALYATEKQNLLVALAPRQEQDDQVAEALFEDLW